MPLKSEFPDHVITDEPLHEHILKHLPEFGDGTALIDRATNRRYSFRDVLRIAPSVAVGLRAAGVNKGDLIVLCTQNCPEYVFCLLGALHLGAVTTGINPFYTQEEVEYYLADSGASYLVTSQDTYRICQKAADNLTNKQLKKIWVIGKTSAASDPGAAAFEELMIFPFCGSQTAPFPKIWPKTDVAVLPYSSGTTGKPKGVMLSHFNLVAEVLIVGRPFFMVPEEGEAFIGQLPFYHIFGFLMMLLCLKCGATMVTMPKYDPDLFLSTIQQFRPKVLAVPPPIFLFLAKGALVEKYDISSLEALWVGSAPIGKQLCEEVQCRHKNIKYIVQGYGMTEGCAASHLCPPLPPDMAKYGSCGLLLPNHECKVVDLESGTELGPEKTGEIWVRSAATMLGYLNKAQATAETVDTEGWLHTGDLGYYDEDGYFYVVDRLKELIKVSGFQVAPAELEALLLRHDAVRDVGVVGAPDAAKGEVPVAFVVLKEPCAEKAPVAVQLMKFVEGKVVAYKRLRNVFFVDDIPRALSGKILRRELREIMLKIMSAKNSKL